MRAFLIVFLGAGFGGALRHGVNLASGRLFGFDFPIGTLFINVAGSLLMGLIAGWFAFRAAGGANQSARLFLTTGMLGGFTTFSTFSLETMLLWERGQTGAAAVYVTASVLLALLGCFAGLALMRAVS